MTEPIVIPAARLRDVERAAVAEEVASALRHAVRNNLSCVRQAAFFLSRRAEGTDFLQVDARVPKFFAVIESEATKAEQHLREAVGRAAWPEALPVVSLGSAVAAARELVVVPDHVSLSCDVPADCVARIAAEELIVAIAHPLQNALEAIGGPGEVSLTVRREGRRVYVRVRDSGGGFGDEARLRAVVPFYSTKPGHMGLGLCVSDRVAKRRGGCVRILESEAGGFVEMVLPDLHDEKGGQA